MKNFVFILALLATCFAQAKVAAPQLKTSSYQPKAYEATYSVFRNGKDLGIANVKFADAGNGRWELTTHTVGTGIAAIAGVEINERSLLRWNEGKPETIDYSFKQKAGWKTKQRSIKVNAETRVVSSQDNDKNYSLKYEPNVIDRHLVTVAVMQNLLQGKRGDLEYAVADRDQLQSQLYRVTGSEKLDTSLGVQNSIKIQRIREANNGRSNTLWLGVDKQFVPLRIEQKENNGDVIEMRIKTLR
jgi:hypothetical protein